MSTRSTIKIEGVNFAKVYKHSDGYPEGMLGWLEAFNTSFNTNRGDDPEYKFAQLLRFSKQYADDFGLDPSNYTGWGVIPFDAVAGEEYEYTLHSDGSVSYKQV